MVANIVDYIGVYTLFFSKCSGNSFTVNRSLGGKSIWGISQSIQRNKNMKLTSD